MKTDLMRMEDVGTKEGMKLVLRNGSVKTLYSESFPKMKKTKIMRMEDVGIKESMKFVLCDVGVKSKNLVFGKLLKMKKTKLREWKVLGGYETCLVLTKDEEKIYDEKGKCWDLKKGVEVVLSDVSINDNVDDEDVEIDRQ